MGVGATTATGAAASAQPLTAAAIASVLGSLLEFTGKSKPQAAKMTLEDVDGAAAEARRGIVLNYPITSRAARSRSASLNGLGSQRQPESSRKRSASVPATSPVTNITRRANEGELAAMAR